MNNLVATNKANRKYPFQVWIAGILAHTVWSLILGLYHSDISRVLDDFGDLLFGIVVMLTVAFCLSIPTFIIYLSVYFLLSSKLKSTLLMIMIQSFIAITGIFITYKLLPEGSLFGPGDGLLLYLVGDVIGILIAGFYLSNIRVAKDTL